MKTAGYSGKQLIDKLGYNPGDVVALIDAPDWFKKYLFDCGVTVAKSDPGWLHGFFSSTDALAKFLHSQNLEAIQKGLWVSWPKKISGVKADVSEQTFRDLILPLGWVDTKVVAVDDTWSGLLFRRRKIN